VALNCLGLGAVYGGIYLRSTQMRGVLSASYTQKFMSLGLCKSHRETHLRYKPRLSPKPATSNVSGESSSKPAGFDLQVLEQQKNVQNGQNYGRMGRISTEIVQISTGHSS